MIHVAAWPTHRARHNLRRARWRWEARDRKRTREAANANRKAKAPAKTDRPTIADDTWDRAAG